MTTEAFKISKRLQISPTIRNGSPTLRDDDIFDDAKFQTSSLGNPQTTRPTDNKDPPVVSGVDGYMESDFKKMNKDQKNKVLAYIGLALLPCLALIPFVLQRDFRPPTDF